MNSWNGTCVDELLRRIVDGSIKAVSPSVLFRPHFRLQNERRVAFGQEIDLEKYREVRCVAIGKAAEAMAYETEKTLGERVSGIIASPVQKHFVTKRFSFFKTGHPFPDDKSVEAGKEISNFVSSSAEDDLLIFLISGGGSASIFVPVDGVTLEEVSVMTNVLLDNGVPIGKINLLRRHLSILAGGRLAALAPDQLKLSLIISDVVGDNPSCIASGPTVHDSTSPNDALRFLEESGLMSKVPQAIPDTLLNLGSNYSPRRLQNNAVKVIASNADALSAAETVGVQHGFNTLVLTRFLELDVEAVADLLISLARSVELEGVPVPEPALILLGGETTVKVRGNGTGGRNQHLVLSALRRLADLARNGVPLKETRVFSFGTDGKDGNSDAAGAFASLDTVEKVGGGCEEIVRYLTDNDSYSFFTKYGGLITTGPTDTNVMDIMGIISE